MSPLLLWPAVAVLGGLASIARFLLDGAVSRANRARFPYGTLAVNLSGTLVLGVLVGAGVHGHAYLLAGTAVIGSYTTFSTWMFETHRLAEAGSLRSAAINLTAAGALGLGAAALGHLLAGG